MGDGVRPAEKRRIRNLKKELEMVIRRRDKFEPKSYVWSEINKEIQSLRNEIYYLKERG